MSDPSDPSTITRLLGELGDGRQDALDALIPLVYDDLRAMAHRRMAQESPGHTLVATALVHEAFARMVDQQATFRNRAHFFAIAARSMRRILIDHARARGAQKRPARAMRVDLYEGVAVSDDSLDEVLAVHQALEDLARLDPRQAQIAEMRYFSGATVEEVGDALSISPATVKREWDTAKLFLRRALGGLGHDA